MYIRILLYYIFGYVNIMVEGYFIERFINICISKRIFLWNIKRKKSTILNTNIGINNFRQVVKIAKQTKCRIKIVRKKGLPFIFNKYKKRKIFALSFFTVVAAIIILSNFIWNIEIVGNSNISKDDIINIMSEQGLEIGKFKNSVNVQKIINNIRLSRDDIAWMGIEIKGTNAIIQIVESTPKPEILNKDEYCNIVATKNGIIVKINAQNGTPMLKPNDEIKQGDIAIAGWLEGKYTGTRYVHSEGEVWAKIQYTDKQKIYYNQTKEYKTGNKEKKISININNFRINFYKRLSNFEKYDTMSTTNKLKLFSDFYLPIELMVNENFEKQEEQQKYTLEEAKEIGIQQAEHNLDEQINDKSSILNKIVNTYEFEEYIEVEIIYEVLEEIGAKEKIIF